MNTLTIVDGCTKVQLVNTGGKLQAYASITLTSVDTGGQIVLNDLRVYMGTSGLFVAYPSDPTHKGEDYRQIFYPVTRELRDQVEFEVLSHFKYEEMRHSGCWVTGDLAVGLVEAEDRIEQRAFALACKHGL